MDKRDALDTIVFADNNHEQARVWEVVTQKKNPLFGDVRTSSRMFFDVLDAERYALETDCDEYQILPRTVWATC